MLVMYTYPLMIAVAGWLTGAEPFTLDRLFAILAAFAGLALALHTPACGNRLARRRLGCLHCGQPSPPSSSRANGRCAAWTRRILMLYLTSTAAVIVGVVSATVVSLEWPRTDLGWTLARGVDRTLRGRQHPSVHRDQDDWSVSDRDHRQQRAHLGHRARRPAARPAHERSATVRRRAGDRGGAAGAVQPAGAGSQVWTPTDECPCGDGSRDGDPPRLHAGIQRSRVGLRALRTGKRASHV